MTHGVRTGVIIPAAGRGTRMGGAAGKQFLPVAGVPLIVRTLLLFERAPEVDCIVIAAREEEFARLSALIAGHGIRKALPPVAGGNERQDSVAAALGHPALADAGLIAVHDAVRPFLPPSLLGQLLAAALETGGAIPAVRPKETVKVGTPLGAVASTPPRETLWLAQTPQVFRAEILRGAFAAARNDRFLGTDEASLVERTGATVRIIEGSYENIKLTTPEDFRLAEILAAREGYP